MKSFAKKAAAVILCLVIFVSAFAPAAAASVKNAEKSVVLPHINIHGFINSDIYSDKNDPNSEKLWHLETKEIVSDIAGAVPALFKYMFTKDKAYMMSELIGAANKIFAPLACGPDGKPVVKDSGAYFEYPTKEQVEADPEIEYPYDWRVDPIDTAAKLNDFINYLCDDLGYGKVILECHSNGGTVLLTYFTVYGTEKVYSVCFSASAVYGASFAAELVKGNVVVDGDNLDEYLLGVTANGKNAKLIGALVKVLEKLGVVKKLADFLNELVAQEHDMFYADFVYPVFGNWLNVWAMVPDDSVELGKDYACRYFNADKNDGWEEFSSRVDSYTNTVRANREQTLDKIGEDCNVYVFCFYGTCGIPITSDFMHMNDSVLLSADTSFGARFKDFNSTEKFEKGKYVSPDGLCNGSTARFPDSTWYFKGVAHSYKGETVKAMARKLLYSEGQATVETYAEYPQFMRFDKYKTGVVPFTVQ